jgi:transposase-like protein
VALIHTQKVGIKYKKPPREIMEKRRKFTREFKLEAVRLIKDRGVPYGQASQDLGVHVSQLRNWVKALADDLLHSISNTVCL